MILYLFFLNTLLLSFYKVIGIRKIQNSTINNILKSSDLYYVSSLKGITIDWKNLYPLENESKNNEFKLKKYNDKINDYKTKIDKYTNSHLMGYKKLVELGKYYNNLIDWSIVPINDKEAVIKLKDGYLSWNYRKKVNINSAADNLISFKQYAQENGIPLLYVQNPCKISAYQDKDIAGIKDFTNENADDFLLKLRENNVSVLDMRDCLLDLQVNQHELFFRTDHHWKPETGLYASKILAENLNEKYGFSIDTELLNKDNFDFITYKNWFLGSQGKRVTLANTEPDDISLIYPKYDTSFEYKIASLNMDQQGDFSVIYNMDEIKEKSFYNKNPYGAYNYADRAEIVIKNLNAANNLKILFIKDSFVNSVAPFMALGVKQVNVIDLRAFNGSIRNYVKKEKPDLIIVMYNASAFNDDSFKFFSFN